MSGGLRLARVATAAVWTCVSSAMLHADPVYLVKDLGTLGGTLSGALGVNGSRHVVGHSYLPGDAELRAFLDDGGGMRDLGTLGGSQAQARHVNDRDQVVGWASLADGTRHAALWSDGRITDLGSLGGSASDAHWINAHGDVVGSSFVPGDGEERAVLWSGGRLTDLGTLGGTDARAYCINDLGDIVGFARIPDNSELHAVIWRQGTLTDLGTLGGWASHAYCINDYGKVCGWSMKVPNQVSHAFVWSEGTTYDLGTLGGLYSAAFALNSSGVAVGASTDAGGQQRAIIWDGAALTDLNSLISSDSGWLLTAAYSINDDGAIVGMGQLRGEDRAYLLLPLSAAGVPPASAGLEFSGPAPNPARGEARFDLTLTRPGRARVGIYDLSGRRIRRLADGDYPAGASRVVWDGRDDGGAAAAAGMYFARLEAEAHVLTRRFALVH